jgi:hypothetical protein
MGRYRRFLPVGYPRGKTRPRPAFETVNRDMTYDPSHRSQPLRQERWPAATPAEPWRAYREDDSYPYGIPAVADHQGSHRTTAGVGSRSQPGYADAARGAAAPRYTGYQSNWETSGPSQWSRNGWEPARLGREQLPRRWDQRLRHASRLRKSDRPRHASRTPDTGQLRRANRLRGRFRRRPDGPGS